MFPALVMVSAGKEQSLSFAGLCWMALNSQKTEMPLPFIYVKHIYMIISEEWLVTCTDTGGCCQAFRFLVFLGKCFPVLRAVQTSLGFCIRRDVIWNLKRNIIKYFIITQLCNFNYPSHFILMERVLCKQKCYFPHVKHLMDSLLFVIF